MLDLMLVVSNVWFVGFLYLCIHVHPAFSFLCIFGQVFVFSKYIQLAEKYDLRYSWKHSRTLESYF